MKFSVRDFVHSREEARCSTKNRVRRCQFRWSINADFDQEANFSEKKLQTTMNEASLIYSRLLALELSVGINFEKRSSSGVFAMDLEKQNEKL